MEKGELFKKCLGLRKLIDSSTELDHNMVNYIGYDFKTGVYQVNMMAKAEMASVAFWAVQIDLPYEMLDRFLKTIKKMVDKSEKKYYQGGKKHGFKKRISR